MKLIKLLPTCFLAFGLSLSIVACDDGDDGGKTSDTNANDSTTGEEETEAEGEADAGEDIACGTFCTNYVDMCIQTGDSTEFETNDACITACEAWDQAGINCRNDQIIAGACDQAGNMGSAC